MPANPAPSSRSADLCLSTCESALLRAVSARVHGRSWPEASFVVLETALARGDSCAECLVERPPEAERRLPRDLVLSSLLVAAGMSSSESLYVAWHLPSLAAPVSMSDSTATSSSESLLAAGHLSSSWVALIAASDSTVTSSPESSWRP